MKANRLRFRAWDTLEEPPRMKDWIEIEDDTLSFLFHDCLEPMQSTGLSDRMGAEIFEGDILREKGEVVWHGSGSVGWCTESVWNDGNKHLMSLYAEDENEVIGNIYENPELLEQA